MSGNAGLVCPNFPKIPSYLSQTPSRVTIATGCEDKDAELLDWGKLILPRARFPVKLFALSDFNVIVIAFHLFNFLG